MIPVTYIFNPDHDLALASNSDHFDAPQITKSFHTDCAYLPLWYGEKPGCILVNDCHSSWFKSIQQIFPELQEYSAINSIQNSETQVFPWGWNKTLQRKLANSGVANLPLITELDKIRELSHRELSIKATEVLKTSGISCPIASPAVLLEENQIEDFVRNYPYSIFKSPWSGSGKGICRSLGGLSENLLNRVKNMAKKQGSVLAEPLYNVIQNFAMEFSCFNNTTSFAGYSLFSVNDHGAYEGNTLASNNHIEKILSKLITTDSLNEIKQFLYSFINKEISPFYNGFLGVDMFIFSENDTIKIHPCVEINLRMTMGLVSRKFFDLFVADEKTGYYSLSFFKDSAELMEHHKLLQKDKPLHVTDGKITSGYLSLVPVTPSTHYIAEIEIY